MIKKELKMQLEVEYVKHMGLLEREISDFNRYDSDEDAIVEICSVVDRTLDILGGLILREIGVDISAACELIRLHQDYSIYTSMKKEHFITFIKERFYSNHKLINLILNEIDL